MPDDRDRRDEQEEQGAPRPFWSGTVTFGLVAIPVDLYAASRSGGVRLRMLSERGAPLERRYVCPADGRTLSADDIVRGYKVDDDRYVTVTDEELEALEPEKSREIDLRLFVDAADIPPLLFERGYFLTPSGNTAKAYRLLAETLERTARVGIATFVMRDREYLVAIIAEHGILRAETLRFADEVREPSVIGLPDDASAEASDRRRFERAIQGLEAERLDRDEMRDPYAARLRELIAEKLEQRKDLIEAPDAAEPEAPVDLLAVIRERLKAGERPDREAREDRDEGDDADALDELSHEELYARAQRRQIPGRSRMSKSELIDALRE